MRLFGASSARGPLMTAPAVATASNFLHIPNCYHYYHRHPLPPHRTPSLYHGFNFGSPPARRLDVSVSSLGKSRKKTKKSDSELCEEIREFLGSAGLPEGHVPSVKELLEQGRNDLANLVRRRGYKVIAGLLLANSAETYNGKNDLARHSGSRSEEIGEGHVEQEVRAKTGLDLPGNMVSSRREQILSAEESPLKDEAPKEQGDGNENLLRVGLSREVEDYGSLNKDTKLNFGVAFQVAEKISTDETLKRVAETETTLSASTDSSSVQENQSSFSENRLASEAEIAYKKEIVSPVTPSLDERVAKFMQSGYLDPVEDCVSDLLNDNWEKENMTSAVQKNGPEYVMDGELKSSMKETSQNTSTDSTTARDQITENDAFNGNLESEGVESPWEEKQSDVKHLKLMLHQKELELSQLKEQIQKEKNALELMQIKAENEISKAQKRIWEKDAELRAAEDSLAELKEVQIEYQGEGDTVEVAGSFNGWQGRISMDPLLSDTSTDSVGSRRPSRWSTTLWLYPGKYEIKFVVDGHWTIDPQKESVTRGTISNNIIRVGE